MTHHSSQADRPEHLYPLGLRLTDRQVVVVGGGRVALRRASALLAAGALVRVISPTLTAALGDLAARGLVEHVDRPYADGDLEGAWLAFACTDDPAVNAAIAAAAEQLRIWCSRADDATGGSAWVPAVGRTGRVTVAVHADRDPRRAVAVQDLCLDAVERSQLPERRAPAQRGSVSIVGGGPGDPGLLTVRGQERLRGADVVIADRLAPQALLAELPPYVEVIDAAKIPGGRAMAQQEIHRLLVEHARAGRAVVRFKGGDPFVFGRGMEEVIACTEAGIPVEVVPGVTSAVAVPALAGISLSHRAMAQAFTVVSGHVAPDDPACLVNYAALARVGGTVVLLMAVGNLRAIARALLDGGLPADTPVACVQDGTSSRQRATRTKLLDIAAEGGEPDLRPPAVVVVGPVVGVLDQLRQPALGGSPAMFPPGSSSRMFDR